jgi:hypothetical protein
MTQEGSRCVLKPGNEREHHVACLYRGLDAIGLNTEQGGLIAVLICGGESLSGKAP